MRDSGQPLCASTRSFLEAKFSFETVKKLKVGAEPGAATGMAYGTGIFFKGVNLLANGELVVDFQFDLGSDLRIETGVDLAVDPDDVTNVKRVDATVGLLGHF